MKSASSLIELNLCCMRKYINMMRNEIEYIVRLNKGKCKYKGKK